LTAAVIASSARHYLPDTGALLEAIRSLPEARRRFNDGELPTGAYLMVRYEMADVSYIRDIHERGDRMAKTSVDIDIDKLDKVREILGTESIRETISAAFREVIRVAAVRDLVALGEAGAFDFLLEPGAEERMWG
jgi:Arc/MetJ family transcription regulator